MRLLAMFFIYSIQILAENELRDTVFCVTFDGGNW